LVKHFLANLTAFLDDKASWSDRVM
jgi:hypothetical protein